MAIPPKKTQAWWAEPLPALDPVCGVIHPQWH